MLCRKQTGVRGVLETARPYVFALLAAPWPLLTGALDVFKTPSPCVIARLATCWPLLS